MMRRIILPALVLALLFSTAFASYYSVPYEEPNYISPNDMGRPLSWLQDYLGVTEVDPAYDEPYFGPETYDALEMFQYENGLLNTCVFDAETLYVLMGLPYMDEASDPLIWIPMHGGARYHVDPLCSSMIDPQQMPASCAYELGFDPCLRCCY